MRENIRVTGSHTGDEVRDVVLFIVADRLTPAEGQWRPFKPPPQGRTIYRTLTLAALPF